MNKCQNPGFLARKGRFLARAHVHTESVLTSTTKDLFDRPAVEGAQQ